MVGLDPHSNYLRLSSIPIPERMPLPRITLWNIPPDSPISLSVLGEVLMLGCICDKDISGV